jgi:hypothetical protein
MTNPPMKKRNGRNEFLCGAPMLPAFPKNNPPPGSGNCRTGPTTKWR